AHTTTGCGKQGFPSAQPYLSHTPGANPFCCMSFCSLFARFVFAINMYSTEYSVAIKGRREGGKEGCQGPHDSHRRRGGV
ncbi:hypothetical protein BO66DRAFT_336825, partial [Aspergillus aculeatinus CBS 121060]